MYPEDLIREIHLRWDATVLPSYSSKKKAPTDDVIREILETSFQASFLAQERRMIRFSMAYCSPRDLARDVELRRRNVPIEFSEPRTFSASEIMNLAPAVDPHQLIGLERASERGRSSHSSGLQIWGLIDTGVSWWEFARGERLGSLGGSPPPDALTVSSSKPGSLAVSRAGLMIVSLDQGRFVFPVTNVLDSGPVGQFVTRTYTELHADICKELGTDRYDPKGRDEQYPRRLLVQFIRRVLLRIRECRHGGSILVVPHDWSLSDSRLRDRLMIKYPMEDDLTWSLLVEYATSHRRYFDKLLPSFDMPSISKEDLREIKRLEDRYRDAEDRVRDRAGLLASLTSVDGALVITTKFRMLGFGAEVVAPSPALEEIKLPLIASTAAGESCPITAFGTRHRAAMRFCSSHEDVLAFIVSQDGDVRVAKRVGADVALWSGVDITGLIA